ncbi:TonB-dependent receptor [Aureibaculum sp. 2210JD6-5]|uniref:TonB-dependent receptor n=1 Tax=Aureibaculum sp. 2210JD6-5 TaxID=3103957 RepID=UPI002AAC7CCA|nr:TonB-dependent receptor [Aureibaculum sp. 2210JD6-5]MDY7396108.1 TonB-dependent receptor [Aureibaculum sp. 2210JD6-5]
MKIYISILMVWCGLFLHAQNTLSGKITDINNQPLIGAEIYAPELHKGTITDIDGNYFFKNLPKGSVTIVFSYIGFNTKSETLKIEEKETVLNVVLEESVFKMDEVILSTPFNKLQSENVMKVEHKTIQQLQRSGAASLVEGISNIAGVSQISTGIGIGKPVIRGLSGNRVLVYSQGVRLENQQFGSEHGLGLNDNGVESVEVIKGPASLLYGSDALGGVLYFNPEKFANANTTKATINQKYFTNTIGSNTSFTLKSSAENIKFIASMGYNSHHDYKIPDGERVTNSRFNEFDAKAGFGFELKNFSSDNRFNLTTSTIGISEEIGAQNTHITPQNPYQRIDNYIVSSHNHIYFNDSNLDIHLGYTANNRREFEEHHEHEEDHEEEEEHHEDEHNEASLHMKLKTFTYDAQYHLPTLGKFESILGVQGLTQKNTNFGEELLIPNANVNDFGAFATVNIKWDTHFLQAGIRFDTRNISTEDHFVTHDEEHEDEDDEHEDEEHEHAFEAIDNSYRSFTASLGYKTTLFKKVETRLNLATGFRAPNLAELTSNGVHHGTNRFEIGNSDLKNEQNYQIDLSLEYYNDHIEFFANGFLNVVKDYIFLTPTGTTIDDVEAYTYVQDNSKLYGSEFGFHLHPHPLDWLHLESSFEMVIGKQDNGDYLPLIPANQFNNTLRGEFNIKNWLANGYASIKLESVFDQNNIGQFETKSDGYQLLHLGMGGDFNLNNTKFNLSFTLNNALNTEYISHLSRLKSEGIYNMGRTAMLGLKFNL